jgi:hypothetical protein
VEGGGEIRSQNILDGECTANRKKLMVMRDLAGAAKAGLCDSCRHVQVNKSDRGSVFYFCRLSASDARFPKYPRLPVVTCAGYEKRGEGQRTAGE